MKFKNKKLNLACGNKLELGENWINHDLYFHRKDIDVAWDLNIYPYPFIDNTFAEIKAWDIIEHLDSPMKFIEQCWRIMQNGAKISIRTNTSENKTAWRDITHKRVFDKYSFDIFDKKTSYGKKFGFYIRNDTDFNLYRQKIDKNGALYIVMYKRSI
jgi:SAM-dependent methyltransferase